MTLFLARHSHPQTKTLQRSLAAATGGIGSLALIGWIFHIDGLTSVFPGLITMKFNTAAAIVLLSVAQFLPRRPAACCTLLASAIAIIAIVEYSTGLNFLIDTLIVSDSGRLSPPGRMSLVTACCIVVLSCATIWTGHGRRVLVQSAATVVAAVGGLILLGYLYGVPYLYYIGPFSTPSLGTAVALALLSAAILLAVDDSEIGWVLHGRDAGATALRYLLPLFLVVLPLLGYLRLRGQQAGWYDLNFGLAMMISVAALLMTFVMWIVAHRLAKVDQERAGTLLQLRALTAELDMRVKDRTADLELERHALRAAEAAARSAQADAERANTAKNEFLSRMSHELRTPLNAVLGFAQLLERGLLSPSQQHAVGHISAGGRHLLAMINDLLDITGIESDRLEVTIEPVRLDKLLIECVGLVRPLADAGRIDIRFASAAAQTTEAPRHLSVSVDRRRLQQIVLNLLSNAIKYNRPGGSVTLGAGAGTGSMVRVAIADTGIGVCEADLKRLFEPFDRLGQQVSTIEGSGIGLALSQRLAVLMGGALEVESVLDGGTTFTLTLPGSNP